jgi:hypothetical protein
LLLTDMIKDAVDVALEDYKNSQNNHPEAMAHDEKPVSGSRFFMLNTNKRNNEDDHRDMVTNGVAAAFYHPWKEEIAKIKEGSVVFLYENGVGIVGTGVAPSEVEKAEYQGQPGEAYRKKLIGYKRVKPLNAKEIRKVVGGNLVFLRTLVGVPTEYGQKILKNLKDA